MAHVDWEIKGPAFTTCNCDWGCPCQFNALPTRGDCRAALCMRIDKGHFGDTDLSGVKFAGMFAWPKAIHEGNGETFVVVDESATEAQRNGILTILSGAETEPGATIFNVFAPTFTTVHQPQFLPIDFEVDIEKRHGRFSIDGVIESEGEPIKNPITGEEHQVRVSLPHGFEYTEAEYGSGSAKATGHVPLDWEGRHAHFALLHMVPTGPVR